MSNPDFDFTLVIPAFNEEKLIGITLQSLTNYFEKKGKKYEIIVVDDGSTDRTVELAQAFERINVKSGRIRVLSNQKKPGKGSALRQGMLTSNSKKRIFMDADMPFELDGIDEIIQKLNSGCQVVVGSRELPGSTLVRVPFMRFLAGQVFSLCVHLFTFRGIRDTQCGLKGFTGEVAEQIFSLATIDDFGIDVELLYIAKKFKYKICKIPVRMTGFRGDSRIRLFSDSIKMFLELWLIRWNDLIGKYDSKLKLP